MAKVLCRFGALLGLTMTGSLMVASSSAAGEVAAAPFEKRPLGEAMQAPASEAFDVLAAEEALAKADPRELALAEAKASYRAYLMTGTMAAVGIDPTKADPAVVQMRMAELEPWAAEEADRWAASVDVDALPLEGPPAKYECKSQHGCPYWITCESLNARCYVHQCGDGKCPSCSEFADLANLVIRSWCAYTCKIGDNVVGSAALVITKPFEKEIFKCLKK